MLAQRIGNPSQVAFRFSELLPGDAHAWIDSTLGAQRFDYHNGFVNDCGCGVYDSIAFRW
jgi:hypothetical protein